MRIAVVGVGGVGAYFGAKLAEAHDVVLVARPGPHGDALAAHGLRLCTDGAPDASTQCAVTVKTSTSAVGPCDVVLVCVKARDLLGINLAPLLAPERRIGQTIGPTLVLPLLNGVDVPYQLRADLDQRTAHVLGGFARRAQPPDRSFSPRPARRQPMADTHHPLWFPRIFAWIDSPGVVRYREPPSPSIVFGPLGQCTTAAGALGGYVTAHGVDRAAALHNEFGSANTGAEIADEPAGGIRAAAWHKRAPIAP